MQNKSPLTVSDDQLHGREIGQCSFYSLTFISSYSHSHS